VETATRLLELLALLHAQPTWRAVDLAERLDVTTRTIRRDVRRLRSLDHPIEAVPGPHGGYRLGRGSDVPPLVLDDQEALAVVLGLRFAAVGSADGLEQAATSALAKLERVLPERLGDQLRDVQDATVALSSGRSIPAAPEQLLALAQACRRRRRARFLYTTREDVRSLRLVDPLRLVHAARRWYLVAFDLDRDDWRTFRVDRASSVLVTDVDCAPRDAPDAAALVRAALTVSSYELQAVVDLDLTVEAAAARVPTTLGLVEPGDDGRARLRIGAWDADWLVGYLAGLPCRVEVVEPPELREAFAAHVARLLA
jgi:predicted DNA-binding transcriptional regulator YafY